MNHKTVMQSDHQFGHVMAQMEIELVMQLVIGWDHQVATMMEHQMVNTVIGLPRPHDVG